MRDGWIALLLSVMLGGFAPPEVDAAAPDAPSLTIAATLDEVIDDAVLEDEHRRIDRSRVVSLIGHTTARPTFWTLHRDGVPRLAACLWPVGRDVARVSVARLDNDGAVDEADARTLLWSALRACHEAGFLKISLHTPADLAGLLDAVGPAGFNFHRRHDHGGLVSAEFYRNLYWRPRLA